MVYLLEIVDVNKCDDKYSFVFDHGTIFICLRLKCCCFIDKKNKIEINDFRLSFFSRQLISELIDLNQICTIMIHTQLDLSLSF